MALASAFLSVCEASVRDAFVADQEALEQALVTSYQRARVAWPQVEVPPEEFARYIAARMPDGGAPVQMLAQMHVEDLYLACACVRGQPGAFELLERGFVEPVARAVARGSDGSSEDLQQLLGERLVVAVDGQPRLAGYGGRGPLISWIRVAAVRVAINARLSQRPEDLAHGIELLAMSTVAPDAELTLLRVQCRDEFRDAFSAALASLAVRERAVLRFHFLEGLTGDTLARMYDVSRRTVHRWLEQSLDTLLAGTRERLSARLSMPPAELESLMQALQSELGSALLDELRPPRH